MPITQAILLGQQQRIKYEKPTFITGYYTTGATTINNVKATLNSNYIPSIMTITSGSDLISSGVNKAGLHSVKIGFKDEAVNATWSDGTRNEIELNFLIINQYNIQSSWTWQRLKQICQIRAQGSINNADWENLTTNLQTLTFTTPYKFTGSSSDELDFSWKISAIEAEGKGTLTLMALNYLPYLSYTATSYDNTKELYNCWHYNTDSIDKSYGATGYGLGSLLNFDILTMNHFTEEAFKSCLKQVDKEYVTGTIASGTLTKKTCQNYFWVPSTAELGKIYANESTTENINEFSTQWDRTKFLQKSYTTVTGLNNVSVHNGLQVYFTTWTRSAGQVDDTKAYIYTHSSNFAYDTVNKTQESPIVICCTIG